MFFNHTRNVQNMGSDGLDRKLTVLATPSMIQLPQSETSKNNHEQNHISIVFSLTQSLLVLIDD